jgi:hypothetical protein
LSAVFNRLLQHYRHISEVRVRHLNGPEGFELGPIEGARRVSFAACAGRYWVFGLSRRHYRFRFLTVISSSVWNILGRVPLLAAQFQFQSREIGDRILKPFHRSFDSVIGSIRISGM